MVTKSLLEILPLMKNGDIADCTTKHVHSITKKDGTFYFYYKHGVEYVTRVMTLDDRLIHLQYKLRPRFITWQEAFQDLKDGYTIRGYDSEEMDSYYDLSDTDTTMSLAEEFPALDIATLFQLKWVSMKEEK
ncbi:hypothetical protein [Phage f2b1]|nr:hypothetical protein [Phage f2b1]